MIYIDHLSFTYEGSKRAALTALSMQFEPGSFTGLVGGSGSGKSTLLAAMAGIIPHFRRGAFYGRVITGGLDTVEVSPLELARFAVFAGEDPESQLTCDTVEEEVFFGLENFGVPHSEIQKRTDEALSLFGLSEQRHRETSALSGGQQQRLLLAAATALRPSLLLLDNPSSELDPAATETLYEALSTLNKKGITIVAAEQKLDLLCRVATKLAVLEEGRLIAFGATEEVMASAFVDGNHGLRLPQLVRLSRELEERGLYEGAPLLSVAQAETAVRRLCNA